nr:MAG: DNA pilot protein [Microvirus sp.]
MPGPALAAAPAAAGGISAGAGALYGGLAAGGATLLSGQLNKGVNFRGKYERARAHFARKQLGPDTRARVEAVKSAGLHPLAALGITPGASTMSNAGSMPGQSPDFGSAVSEGLRTAQSLYSGATRDAHSKTMAGLQLQEQGLRNDWLETQIATQRIKMAAALANVSQDRIALEQGPGATQPGEYVFSEFNKAKTGVTTSAQAAEDRGHEIAGFAQGLLNIGYDIAGNTLPKDFGTGRVWQGDNRPNDPTTGKMVSGQFRQDQRVVKYPVQYPKYPTRAHKSRRGRY